MGTNPGAKKDGRSAKDREDKVIGFDSVDCAEQRRPGRDNRDGGVGASIAKNGSVTATQERGATHRGSDEHQG